MTSCTLLARSGLLLSCVLALATVMAPRTLRADDEHYQNYLTGGRAVTLGGAFTALGNDPSGLVFNPAGLVDDAHTDISMSANLYGFERSDRDGNAASPIPNLTNLTAVATDLVIIPQASGATRTFTKAPDGDGYLNAIAVGVFVPSYRSAGQVLAAGTEREYRRSVTDRLFMPGIGYARRLGALRLGISAFYVLRALNTSETSSVVRSGAEGGGQDAFRLVDSNVSLTSGHLMAVLGAKYVFGEQLSFGASIALPAIPLNTSADVRFRRGVSDPTVPDGSRFASITRSLRSGWRPTPTLRLGGAYIQPDFFTFAVDMSFHFPMKYRLVELDAATSRDWLPFANEITRNTVVNFNVGVEFMPWKTLTVGGGFFTDFSSSPRLSGARFSGALANPTLSSIDLYGFAATVGFSSEYTVTRVGVTYALGKGYDVVAEDNVARLFDGTSAFRRVELFTSFFYIFVSSTLQFL